MELENVVKIPISTIIFVTESTEILCIDLLHATRQHMKS